MTKAARAARGTPGDAIAVRRYFGTDGVRGVAGEGSLAPDNVERLGWALARFAHERTGRSEPVIVLGRDPRPSGPTLQAALVAGLRAGGARVHDAGVLPSPTLAWAVARRGYDLGCMLSASHNPSEYNGIKAFAEAGRKLTIDEELEIEAWMDEAPAKLPSRGNGVTPASEIVVAYVDETLTWLRRAGPLDGLRVVVDLSGGAATETAPALLESLGAHVIALHAAGDHVINDGCGSEHPEAWLAALRDEPGAYGLAFDGDADRILLADATGEILDGDDLLAILAQDSITRYGEVPASTVVSTVMSNLGLEEFLAEREVTLNRSPVGDRNVAEAMRSTGAVFGGEPSGHVVLERADVLCGQPVLIGDALVAAVRVLQATIRSGLPLSVLRERRTRHPQLLVNVKMAKRIPLDDWPAFQAERKRQEVLLGDQGRLVLRYSGTEPLLRVMGEGKDPEIVKAAVEALADVARATL